jgi:hypothetical protein
MTDYNKLKQQTAENIKGLVDTLNKAIEIANQLSIDVKFVQNPKMGKENSQLSVFVSETISY